MPKVSVPTLIGDGLVGSKASPRSFVGGSSMYKPLIFGYKCKRSEGMTKVEKLTESNSAKP